MPFQQEVEFADELEHFFGKYLSTFDSKTGQVRAVLFEQSGQMVAHVSFPTGMKPEDVTDAYVGELYQYAKKRGFEGKVRLLYAE